jgi:2-polyprenyl-3-methyl-5-hydroxy-6-metoxy-1,4-benzoquinol methylase
MSGEGSARRADAEARLEASWSENAAAWTEAVRRGLIESRRVVTDRAVLAAVAAAAAAEAPGDRSRARVLDVGCGEGWLARRLAAEGHAVVGFDGSAELVERAREMGGGTFLELSYERFTAAPAAAGSGFDVAVCNFSLLGESLTRLLTALGAVVTPAGRLVIQTVNPATADEGPDGWREERFEPLRPLGFAPMPWYHRSVSSWRAELERSGWAVADLAEPADPRTGAPASLVITARKDRTQGATWIAEGKPRNWKYM